MLDQNAVVERFGQLFVFAFDGPRLTREVAEFFRTFRIGGVILFADNYRSPAQLAALTTELQAECAHPEEPLFIATDHEGGRVQRFADGFTPIPPMSVYGARDAGSTEAVHRTIARELRRVGVSIDFAPVADLCRPDTPGAIGDRSFGDDPVRAADHVVAAIRGLQGEGMLACVKHFPGHGSTEVDSHRDLPWIPLDRTALDARDLVPFRAAIDAGVGAVMTAHAVYPEAGDAALPASMSPHWIRTVLREELGFDGLIVSDAIEMAGLTRYWSPTECGRRALAAGTDVVIYYKEASQFEAFHRLRRALQDGQLDRVSIGSSLERVRRAKERWLHGTTRADESAAAPAAGRGLGQRADEAHR